MSEFYSKWREHCQYLFSLFDWLAKQVHKISLVKKLTVWELKVEFESFHELKFYPPVLLLIIKMSQSALGKLESYCKSFLCTQQIACAGERSLAASLWRIHGSVLRFSRAKSQATRHHIHLRVMLFIFVTVLSYLVHIRHQQHRKRKKKTSSMVTKINTKILILKCIWQTFFNLLDKISTMYW